MSIFCSKLKEELEDLRLSKSELLSRVCDLRTDKQRLSKKISDMTNRNPLLYTIYLTGDETVEVIADDYSIAHREFEWGLDVFLLNDRVVATFYRIKGFTTEEIDEQ